MSGSAVPPFLTYVPVPLAFGTSGMRGLVVDLTDLEVYISIKGALRYLLGVRDIEAGSVVVLGGDLRPSTDRIMRACLQAIVDVGCGAEYVGKLPTPALVLHGVETRRAGVMVTGSHIPFDRNGIKVSRSVGELLKSDEDGVLGEIAKVRADEYAKSAATSGFDSAGMLKQAPLLPERSGAAEARYQRRYLEAFPPGFLRGRRIAFYEHSAVGRELLPEILTALGAEVVRVGRSDTFVPIDTENISDEDLAALGRMTKTIAAVSGAVDAIVSTDGDSDRPLMAAVTQGAGPGVRFLPGDLLGLVVAEYLRADAVAVPVSANDAIEQRLRALNVPLQKTRIGSPYVIAALAEQQRSGAQRVVGWEANGGFLLGTDIALPSGTLRALPTRDALLPLLAHFAAATALGLRLDEVWDRLPARFGRAGLIDNVPVQVGRAIVAQLAGGDAGRIQRFFTSRLGFGDVTRVDTTDGARVLFANGDVAHLRPSGNAPQLRIYANADSQARADEIVALALREPDGILRQLERALAQ